MNYLNANHEAPWSLLLFSRLENNNIKQQVLETLFTANRGRISKPILEGRYYEDLESIETETPVIFSGGRSKTSEYGQRKRERISVGYFDYLTGRRHTWKERHITEAHEKGHVIRWDYSLTHSSREEGRLCTVYCLSHQFVKAFDFSNVSFSPEEYEKRRRAGSIFSGKTNCRIRQILVLYLSGPHELAERMSQLKNYFGFSGDEKFTKEHLDHARKHYVEDTGYDNLMTQFFQAITSEREDSFLFLINSVGI